MTPRIMAGASSEVTATSGALAIAIQSKPFRLLDLPAELWTKICKIAIDDMAVTREATRDEHDMRVHHCQPPIQPALTRTCRIIRHETLSYYTTRLSVPLNAPYYGHDYGVHEAYTRKLGQWLQIIGRSRCQIKGVQSIWYIHEDNMDNDCDEEERRSFAESRECLRNVWDVPFEFGEVQLVSRKSYSFWRCSIKFT